MKATERVHKRSGAKEAVFPWALKALMLIFLTSPSAAQSPAKPAPSTAEKAVTTTSLAGQLSQILQRHARAALERHVRPEEFQLFVSTTPVAKQDASMPYLPETLEPVPGGEVSMDQVTPWLAKVEIEVMLSERFDKAARSKLETILKKTLALDTKRGDKVTFLPLGLKVDPPLSDTQRELARSEAESRELKSQLDKVQRERDDAKRDLSLARAELDKIAREKGDKAKDGTTGTDAGKTENVWQTNLPLIIAALLVTLMLAFVAIAMRSAANILGKAVQTIGSGLPALGDKLAESLSQQRPSALPVPEYGMRRLAEGDRPSPEAGTMAAHPPIEMVARQLLEIRDELNAAVTSFNENIVLEYLNGLLGQESTVGHAVATLELLGKERSKALFNRLTSSQQQKIASFLGSGVYARNKNEIMLEVGEAIKSRLFGAELPSRVRLDHGLRLKLAQLGIQDLVAIVTQLDGDLLARFFAYIGPAKLGAVMTSLHKEQPAQFARVAAFVTQIPSVEASADLDQDLTRAIEDQIAQATDDIHEPYLPYYRSLLQSVDEDVAEELNIKLSSADTRVNRYLTETIVTFATLFKLDTPVQEDILTGMSNRDLAGLLASLKDEDKTKIYGFMDKRRRELVEDESKRLANKGPRIISAAHRTAKQLVVSRILQIKGDGSLADLLSDSAKAKSDNQAANIRAA